MDILRPNVIDINGRNYRRLAWSLGQTEEPHRNEVEDKVDLGRFAPTDCRLKDCFSGSIRHF